jgi:hypothetical protein
LSFHAPEASRSALDRRVERGRGRPRALQKAERC